MTKAKREADFTRRTSKCSSKSRAQQLFIIIIIYSISPFFHWALKKLLWPRRRSEASGSASSLGVGGESERREDGWKTVKKSE